MRTSVSRRPRLMLRAAGFALLICMCRTASAEPWTVTGDVQRVSDPAIIKSGGRYYIFCSGPGIPVRVSADMHQWDLLAPVFADLPEWAKEKVPGARWVWAPDISFRAGRYWLYYAVSTLGSRRSVIGLATNTTLDAKDPAFRWQDQGLVWETHETDNYNAIDPNAVEASDGQLYLAFGSFWTGLKMVLLDRETGKPKPSAELKPIASRPGAEAIEGACVFKHGEYFYLFCSHDFTARKLASTYKVVVGRSREATGPFVDRTGRAMLEGGGTTIVANDARWRGPGHNSVLEDNGMTWLVYHAINPVGRPSLTLRIDTIQWTADGWPEVEKPVPPIYGWWERTVAGKTTTIRILPDGKIEAPDGSATWTLIGDTLEARWPDPSKPGSEIIERCTVAANRRSFSGRDHQGAPIEGRVSVIGWWEHRVGNGAASMVRLLPDGRIDDVAGGPTWKQTDDTLEFRWPNPAAPGGVWIDTLKLSADHSAYEGSNQDGFKISGWQVASE